ncbi:hypothetical protein [Devosia sp.]
MAVVVTGHSLVAAAKKLDDGHQAEEALGRCPSASLLIGDCD